MKGEAVHATFSFGSAEMVVWNVSARPRLRPDMPS
jgi:hypothetical protein